MNLDPTQCINPPPLSDERLSDIIDGLADRSAVQHAADCPYCGARLQAMRAFDEALERVLYRCGCPDSQTLSDYEFGFLEQSEQAQVRAHIAECTHCQEELQSLSRFMSATMTGQDPEAARPVPRFAVPYELHAQIVEGGAARTRGSILGPVILTVDESFSLTIERVDSAGKMTLMGQLLVDEFERYEDTLVQVYDETAELLAVTRVGALGEFECQLYQTDAKLTLRLSLPDGTFITLPELTFSGER